MMIIGEVLVEDAAATGRFCCDLPRCRGACCTLEGARGAPLLDEEKGMIERVLPAVRKYLSPRSLSVIGRTGAVEGFPGSYATSCIGHRDCVFVMYDGVIAKCAIEHAYNRGEIAFRKPVSCHLFPLRYSGASPGVLRYEEIPECSAGRAKGETAGRALREFAREALVRRFGEAWTEEFDATVAARALRPEGGTAATETPFAAAGPGATTGGPPRSGGPANGPGGR